MTNEMVIDQPTPFHEPNKKKVRSRKIMYYLILQTKHVVGECNGNAPFVVEPGN